MLVKIVVTIGIIAVFFYIRNSVKKWSREWNMKEIAGKVQALSIKGSGYHF